MYVEASGCQAPCPDPSWTPAFHPIPGPLQVVSLDWTVMTLLLGHAGLSVGLPIGVRPPVPMSWHVVSREGLGSKALREVGRLGPSAP